MKKNLTILKKLSSSFLKKHHFIFLMVIFLIFIAWAGFYWRKVYLLINEPVESQSTAFKIDRTSAEEIQALFQKQAANFASSSTAEFPNVFR